jgi:hypothetical protein
MNDDKLNAIAAEIERQNEALEELEATLQSLGDVELAIPQAFLDELDELTTPRPPTPAMPIFGIRG